jgi:hypothetical protein
MTVLKISGQQKPSVIRAYLFLCVRNNLDLQKGQDRIGIAIPQCDRKDAYSNLITYLGSVKDSNSRRRKKPINVNDGFFKAMSGKC